MPELSGLDLAHIRFSGKPSARAPLAGMPFRPAAPAGHRAAARPAAEEPLPDGFAARVLAAAGIDPRVYRAAPLQRRVPACLRALKVKSEAAGAELLAARPERLAVAVSALLIGVTQFFRDPAVFRDLDALVLPDLTLDGRPVRAWSAACSSGEELYSLAMLLAERGRLAGSDLLGTDCRGDAVASAEAGVFPRAAVGQLPAGIRSRYFEPAGRNCCLIEPIRSAVRWRTSDVSREIEEGPWDLIFCRNVAIYLAPQPACRLASRLAAELRSGGYLVVGRAERPLADAGMQQIARCIYRKR